MTAPVALTIAGSDPSGGAGIQADLKTFSALEVYGTSVLTALTAQNTRGVDAALYLEPEFVLAQLNTLVADVGIEAVKIGMLGTPDLVHTVQDFLSAHPYDTVVLDPVMVATSGDALSEPDTVTALRGMLRFASLITPNLAEAAALLRQPVAADIATMHQQAAALVDLGAARVLLKGGHLSAAAIDVFHDGTESREFAARRVPTSNTHGTGCSLSSAITAFRARSYGWPESIGAAKAWLTEAIAAADTLGVGGGHGPVHHFHRWWPGQR